MSVSKAWNWKKEKNGIWLYPSEESYAISARWQRQGYQTLLDFGCGLGRHSIFFAQQGFTVSAFDLSKDGTEHLRKWAKQKNLDIDVRQADMLSLPYADNSMDCLFAYHVISHTDTPGMQKILQEIQRVVAPEGEIYLTLCSKESDYFSKIQNARLDENTIVKMEDGPEKGVPHFYADLDDIIQLFSDADIELIQVRHTDDCYWDGEKRNCKHYFILAKNKMSETDSHTCISPAEEI